MILGIDFGTSNSCCSFFDGKESRVIINEYGNEVYPTCIAFNKNTDEILYANSAYDLSLSKDVTVIKNIKGYIGLDEQEIEIMYNNNLKKFTVNEIIVLYLKYLKGISENFTGTEIKDIIITVPAYFSNIQRAQIKSCCEQTELNVIRMINEPTSAILAYCWERLKTKSLDTKYSETKNILVVDCGGGTTDYSIINADFEDQLFEVINVYGDNNLGGNDLTNGLYDYILNEIYLKFKDYPNNIKKTRLWNLCESVKRRLSFNERDLVFIENVVDDKDFSIVISRLKFYDINKKFFDKIKGDILIVTDNKKISIDEVIFVGGTTRIPLFIDICKEIFGGDIKINNKIKGDVIVSIGAGIQGYLLSDYDKTEDQDIILMDVTPMSLGIKTYDNKMAIIISKNTPIPVSKSQVFTNSDNVETLSIDIYQGDNMYVKDNIFLESLNLIDLNNGIERGKMRIKVTFSINVDGILNVSAKEMLSEKENTLIVKYDKDETIIDDISLDFLEFR